MKKSILCSLFILLTLIFSKSIAGADEKSKSPVGAAIRSALIPGWGQFYTEEYLKGFLLSCTEISLISEAVIQEYKKRSKTEKEKYINRRNRFIIWFLGVKMYSVTDAYVAAHLYEFGEDEVSLNFNPEDRTIQLIWTDNL